MACETGGSDLWLGGGFPRFSGIRQHIQLASHDHDLIW